MRTAPLFALCLLALTSIACGSSDDDAAAAGAGGSGTAGSGTAGSAQAGSGTCPQAATLLDVSKAPGAGAAYAKPTLSGSCTATAFVVDGNGIPTYTFVQTTPNPLQTVAHHYEIPLAPEVAAATTEIPLLGLVGFAVNGLPFFGPNEAAMPADSAYGDPVYNGLMDPCLGHTAAEYHYHSFLEQCLVPSGLVEKPWTNAAPDATKASPVLGWALDGFAIWGQRECVDAGCTQIRTMKSGYAKTGDPKTYAWKAYTWMDHPGDDTYLDACNGHTGADGKYHYHATEGFPYILGCFKGTASGTGQQGMGMGGGTGTGPTTCTTSAECTGACPPGSKGCTCASTGMGLLCIPTCDTATDCPMGPDGGTLKCMGGMCVP